MLSALFTEKWSGVDVEQSGGTACFTSNARTCDLACEYACRCNSDAVGRRSGFLSDAAIEKLISGTDCDLPSLQVRMLRGQDARAYFELMPTARGQEQRFHGRRLSQEGANRAEEVASMLAEHRADEAGVVGVFVTGRLAGAVELSRASEDGYGDAWKICGITVAQRYDGTPVSRVLIQTAIGLCLGASRAGVVFGVCRASNESARSLFVRNGFVRMTRDQERIFRVSHDDGLIGYI